MKKEDIDLYLSKMNSKISDEEKRVITRDFYNIFLNDHIIMNANGTVSKLKDMTFSLLNHIVGTGALNLAFSVGISEIENMANIIRPCITTARDVDKTKFLKQFNTTVEKFIKNPEALTENPTQEQINIYDENLVRYVDEVIVTKGKLDDETKSIVNAFFEKIPDEKTRKNTLFYKKNMSIELQNKPDIAEVLPKKSKEEYKQIIDSFARNVHGEIVNFRTYDSVVNEYLTFYGDSISRDEKASYLKDIMDYQFSGEIHLSKTYTEYFSKSQRQEDKDILKEYDRKIVKECFARLYENKKEDIKFTEYESELLDKYLERKMIPNPKRKEPITAASLQEPTYIEDKTQLEKDLEYLFDSSDTEIIDIAKYIIRLKDRYIQQIPNDPIAKKLHETIKDLNITEILERNLKDFSDRNADAEAINSNGLTVIDCADIALELMLEASFFHGSYVISKIDDGQEDSKKEEKDFNYSFLDRNEFKYLGSLLNQAGRSIHDSRAMRKMVELYVDRIDEYQNVDDIYLKNIFKYINAVVTKPDFNLFKEQGVSDLLQLIALEKDSRLSFYAMDAINNALDQNPNYAINLEDAQEQADRFVREFSNKPIDSSREEDFDKFLINLSKIRLSAEEEKFVLPREYVNFLIKQTIDFNSVINTKRDKYTGVAERAIEELGKLDNIDFNGLEGLEYTYKTRDYLSSDRTVGIHHGETVESKRNQVRKLFKGDLTSINTMHHENTHMTQRYRLDRMPTDYKEYLMQKERIIRSESPEYYTENYSLQYIEIEARERAAQKTAAYIGNNLLSTSVTSIAEYLRNSVVDLFTKKYKDMQQKYVEMSEKESTLYEPGLNKKDKNGKVKTINEILDTNSLTVIANNMKSNPGLRYEYDIDGKKRNLSDQIDFALNPNIKIDRNLMREIIRENEKTSPDSNLGILQAAIEYSTASRYKSKKEFLEGVLDDNLLNGINRFKTHIKKGQTLNSRNDLIAYYKMSELLKLHEQGKKLPNILDIPTRNGKTPIDAIKEMTLLMEEKNPHIKESAEALHKFEFNENGTKKTLQEQIIMFNTKILGLEIPVVQESLKSNRNVKENGLEFLPYCFLKNIPENKQSFYNQFLNENLANSILYYRDSLQNRDPKCNLSDIETYRCLLVLQNWSKNAPNNRTVLNNIDARTARCINQTLKKVGEKWSNINQKLDFFELYQAQGFNDITGPLEFAKINPKHVDYEIVRDSIKQSEAIKKDCTLELLTSALNIFLSKKQSGAEVQFINGVLKDNVKLSVDNYINVLQNDPNIKYSDVCEKYNTVKFYSEYIKKHPNSNLLNGLKVTDKDGKNGIDRIEELKNMMEEKYPKIDIDSRFIQTYVKKEDGTELTFDEQMTMALNPNNNVHLDVMKNIIREHGSLEKVTSLSAFNDILKYRMMANIGRKDLDGTYSTDTSKKFFVDDVYTENLHAYIDSYQKRLSNNEITDKEQLLTDYYTATFLVMDFEKTNMMMSGPGISFTTIDENGKTAIDKIREIRDSLERNPEIGTEYNQCKFKEDGTTRTLSEMIDYARENSAKVVLPFMNTVIRETDVAKDDNSLGMLESLNKFIHIASEEREVKFINDVIKDCLPTCIDNYNKSLEDVSRSKTESDLIAYQNIVTYLSTSKTKNEQQPKNQSNSKLDDKETNEQETLEASEDSKQTITERLEDIKSKMEERWPGIDIEAEKLDNKRNRVGFLGKSTIYDQLKKNKVSVVGKRQAAAIEAKIAEAKHEIEYDG